MNPISYLIAEFKRRRSAKGFGIHSPSAFKFVTEIVHSQYAYYAYTELIDHVPPGRNAGSLIHDALLLHRIAAYMIPEQFLIAGHRNGVLTEAVTKANSTTDVIHKPVATQRKSLVFASHGDFSRTELERYLTTEGNILILRGCKRCDILNLAGRLQTGIILIDSDIAIILVSEKMQLCVYDVRL